jgi:hypothetical protein
VPFRNLETLSAWVEEFEQLGYRLDGKLKVVQQDGAHGANTGLIVVVLTSPPTYFTVQPENKDSTRWAVTIEARNGPVSLDPAELLNFAGSISVLSALCAFLQTKSQAYVGVDQA